MTGEGERSERGRQGEGNSLTDYCFLPGQAQLLPSHTGK